MIKIKAADGELNELIGRTLMIGYEGLDFAPELENLISAVRPAGLILFKRNYPAGGGLSKLKNTIERCQNLAQNILGRPLLMALDHEGGLVQRLPAPFTILPPAREVANSRSPLEAEELAFMAGRELAATGFNLNFAPVADIESPESAFVGSRSFGQNPDIVTCYAQSYVNGYQRAGVLTTAKHFPGLGLATKDPHEELPLIEAPLKRLEIDMAPFRSLIVGNVPSIMTTHALYPALDKTHPATFSSKIITLLKSELGFKGPVLTDDLEMGAVVKHYPPGQAAVAALAAGHDLLLVCRHASYIEECRQALAKALQKNTITRERLAEAWERVKILHCRLDEFKPLAKNHREWFNELTARDAAHC